MSVLEDQNSVWFGENGKNDLKLSIKTKYKGHK